MIIRVTFHDNDFQNTLENLFGMGLFGIFHNHKEKLIPDNTDEGIRAYVNFTKEVDKFMDMISDEKPFTQKENDRFLELLKISIQDYLEKYCQSDFEYLSKELSIKLQKSVSDKWENGEVAYFFPLHNKLIIM